MVAEELRASIDVRAAAGDPLEEIEAAVIDDAPMDEEHRAALWLFAWLRTEGGTTGWDTARS